MAQWLDRYQLWGYRPAAARYGRLGARLDELTAELTGRYGLLHLLYQQQAQLHQEVKHRVTAIRGRMGRIRRPR